MKTPILRPVGNISIDLNQTDTSNSIKNINAVELLGGYLIEDIVLTTTTTLVPHSLGRPVRGFIVVKKNANVDIWYDSTSTTDSTLYIPLDASGTVTVSLWIF